MSHLRNSASLRDPEGLYIVRLVMPTRGQKDLHDAFIATGPSRCAAPRYLCTYATANRNLGIREPPGHEIRLVGTISVDDMESALRSIGRMGVLKGGRA